MEETRYDYKTRVYVIKHPMEPYKDSERTYESGMFVWRVSTRNEEDGSVTIWHESWSKGAF